MKIVDAGDWRDVAAMSNGQLAAGRSQRRCWTAAGKDRRCWREMGGRGSLVGNVVVGAGDGGELVRGASSKWEVEKEQKGHRASIGERGGDGQQQQQEEFLHFYSIQFSHTCMPGWMDGGRRRKEEQIGGSGSGLGLLHFTDK
jgi:hypothetical protein